MLPPNLLKSVKTVSPLPLHLSFLSDNIPCDTLPGNKSKYGIQSISEPHGPSHGLDA